MCEPKGSTACGRFLAWPQLAISFLFKFNRFDQFYSFACLFGVPSVQTYATHRHTHTSPSYDDSSSYQHCTVNRFCRLKITTTTTKMQREKQNDVINFMGKHTSSVIYSNPLQFNPIRRELRACVFAALVCSVCVHKQCHTIGIFLHTDDGLFPPILICF